MATSPPLPFKHPATLIATWFGVGLLPKAPGTWASLAALPLAAAMAWVFGPWLLLSFTILVSLAGVWAASAYARHTDSNDPGPVVVDEVVGQWLVVLPVAMDLTYYPAAFLLFRLFDITKPWPVGWLDRRVPGGLGIMVDDVAAALYAGLLLCFARALLGGTGCFHWIS